MDKHHFPRLADYRKTSEASEDYNCIAWACGDNSRWWWPHEDAFWPTNVPSEETIAAFEELFISGGAERTLGEGHEPGWVKIALFALEEKPTHAARQLSNGAWTSKMGKHIDIAHSLRDLEGPEYGTVVRIFRVRIPI